jgi:uncharacterized membrane protein YpjA
VNTTTADVALDVFGIAMRVIAIANCLLAYFGYAWFADVYSQQPVVSYLVFSPYIFTFMCALLPNAFAVKHYALTSVIHAVAMISAVSKSVAAMLGVISPNDESASIMIIILLLFAQYSIRWRRYSRNSKEQTADTPKQS